MQLSKHLNKRLESLKNSKSEFNQNEIVLSGIPASPGVEYARAFIYIQQEIEVSLYKIDKNDSQKEIDRFYRALQVTKDQINAIKQEIKGKLHESEAQIFDAHLLILEDRVLIEDTIKHHNDISCNIEYCFQIVSRRYLNAFNSVKDEYIRERMTDVRDVTRRVLLNLIGNGEKVGSVRSCLLEPCIIVSEHLTPTESLYFFKKNQVLGILTDFGSRTSHAVIIARSLRVPAVVGLHDITTKIDNGCPLLIDGYDGKVFINPTEVTLKKYGCFKEEKRKHFERIFANSMELLSETVDKIHIKLQANIDRPDEIPIVLNYKAEGIGLFRTENLFLDSNNFPTEEEQFLVYKEIVQKMQGLTVTIRTIDIGGDKISENREFLEDNPFMGLRGIRFCLKNRNVFKTQLRAILRASVFGKLKIMYPMIVSLAEIKEANAVVCEVMRELEYENIPFYREIEIGIMVETPSAGLLSKTLAKHVKFFSIGTNDLVQYLLAVDRVNDKIAYLYEPHNPAVLKMLKFITESANEMSTELSVCGEMASDPIYVPLLIGLGIRNLSMSPLMLPEVKYLIRQLSICETEDLAKRVLQIDDSNEIIEILRSFYESKHI